MRAEKEEAEASSQRQRAAVKTLVDDAQEEGFPAGVEEREAYFNEQVMAGEVLSQDRESIPIIQHRLHGHKLERGFSADFCHRLTTLPHGQLLRRSSLLLRFIRVSRCTLLLAILLRSTTALYPR